MAQYSFASTMPAANTVAPITTTCHGAGLSGGLSIAPASFRRYPWLAGEGEVGAPGLALIIRRGDAVDQDVDTGLEVVQGRDQALAMLWL
jgi:hypothetical protein